MPRFEFVIKETRSAVIGIEANTFEEAMEKAMASYMTEGIDKNVVGESSVQFHYRCDHCGSEFEDSFDLRIVDEGHILSRVICDHCLSDLESDGTYTRCEECGEVFSPCRLNRNPDTDEPELCPYCNKVFCP